MTTNSFASLNNAASEANFRARISEYSAMLTAIGLVKTDTPGQIDPSTVTRPAAENTTVGFEIRQFTDSLQSVAPIFIKIEYGSGALSSILGIWVTVGTVVNAAGDITGLSTIRYLNRQSSNSLSSICPTYGCHTEGFAGVLHKVGSFVGNPTAFENGSFAICRSCDANGYPTADGVAVYMGASTPVGMVLRFKSPQAVITPAYSSNIAHFPFGIGASVGGEVPCFPMWMPFPELSPVLGMLAFPQGLVSVTNTIEIAMVGNTPRKYLLAYSGFQAGNSQIAYGILWE